MKKVCSVRMDDICPTMNWTEFEHAMDLMKQFNIKPLLGVIPDNRDKEQIYCDPESTFWDKIKTYQNEGVCIAMHGYQHVYDINGQSIASITTKSEFAGHTYEEQFEKIRQGKSCLEQHGIRTDIFFAPSHTYDRNTLRALRDNGFKYLSDGRSSKPYMQEGIKCIPCRVGTIPKRTGNGINIAVCHTSLWGSYPRHYDNLQQYLQRNKKYLSDYSELLNFPVGNYYVQKTEEVFFVFWNDIVKRRAAKINFLLRLYHYLCNQPERR